MRVLKAHVKGGRLLLDEPTDLPEGGEVEVHVSGDKELDVMARAVSKVRGENFHLALAMGSDRDHLIRGRGELVFADFRAYGAFLFFLHLGAYEPLQTIVGESARLTLMSEGEEEVGTHHLASGPSSATGIICLQLVSSVAGDNVRLEVFSGPVKLYVGPDDDRLISNGALLLPPGEWSVLTAALQEGVRQDRSNEAYYYHLDEDETAAHFFGAEALSSKFAWTEADFASGGVRFVKK